ncbi:MAG: hypoxanthine phosphoribosyltransferase [Candidatus Rokubacteria bacterium]|nr:hypoxanthine phosphoribosyltransferase [Candidatus Rokubacteria bacterium]MBI3824490.1 hypoxanthine phosphoribosyltransferase [Candidatus Rokubacteria bacterium]
MSRLADLAARPARVLITEDELRARVTALGEALARDYADRHPVLVGVLKGALLFMADLIRAVSIDLETDFIVLASYGAATRSSGVVKLASDLSHPIEDRDVVIVEDIIDTGRTVSYLKRNLETRRPRSVKICALLDKIERREVEVDIDYLGFTIPNVFVVGYGMDHAGLYRNLPHIATLDSA